MSQKCPKTCPKRCPKRCPKGPQTPYYHSILEGHPTELMGCPPPKTHDLWASPILSSWVIPMSHCPTVPPAFSLIKSFIHIHLIGTFWVVTWSDISLTEYQQIYMSTNYKYCLARISVYKLPWMLDNILIICVNPLLFFNSFWHWSYWSLSKISWYRYNKYRLIIWLFIPSISEHR